MVSSRLSRQMRSLIVLEKKVRGGRQTVHDPISDHQRVFQFVEEEPGTAAVAVPPPASAIEAAEGKGKGKSKDNGKGKGEGNPPPPPVSTVRSAGGAALAAGGRRLEGSKAPKRREPSNQHPSRGGGWQRQK